MAYAWEPHWIHATLDLVEVELPPYSDEAWPVSDWPEDVTYNYGSPRFEEEHPDVVALIRNFRMSNSEQAELILAIDVDGRDLDEVVEEWLDNNEEAWRPWVPDQG